MQMRYFDNVTAPPIAYITISAVVAMFLWFLAVADNPQSVIIDNDIKNQICSVLAGYVWDQSNPFVKKHDTILPTLAKVIKMKEKNLAGE